MSDEYESVCFVCRRPESKAGEMIKFPGNMCVCKDCFQRTIDMAEELNYPTDAMNKAISMVYNIEPDGILDSFNKNKSAQDADSFLEALLAGNKAKSDENDEDEKEKPEDTDGEAEDVEESEDEEESKGSKKTHTNPRYSNISFLNLADLMNGELPGRQRIKKKKKPLEPIDLKTILPPHKIKEKLDEYVIGQEQAKKIISVAVYNHYKRVATGTMDEIQIEKSNILMIGPTGSGKTYLVKTLAKLLDVPLAIADATSLTEAGYIGDDIESVVSKLLAAADNDVERAERGIIFIDEIDKIARKKETTSRDVSGESVQQGMLKLLEGSEVEVPVGANSKNAMVPLATVNTRNILFICGGAFPDLEDVVKRRLSKKTSIGYGAELKDKYEKDKNILSKVTVEDIKKFGMIPEFVGRLPVICPLECLDEDMLVQILKEPKNAILKQYQKLLELDEVDLQFSEDALKAIAQKALERDTGARALRAIIEDFMLDIMYEIPKDKNIGKVTITKEYIEGTGGPVIEMRTVG